MIRSLNKYALIGSSLLLLVSFWNRNALPADIVFFSGIDTEPVQRQIARPPFSVSFNGVDYRVEPKFEYELYGLIVSFRQHDGDSRMHRMSNDHLNMADLCVVWSGTARSEYLSKIDFWNGIFTCNFKTSDSLAWSHFDTSQVSNNHLISDNPLIRDRVTDVRIGDQIRIKGWLSHYGAIGGPMRGTSTTRDDTGDGACETIFVNEFEIVEPGFNRWRFAMYLSLAVLAAALIVHFSLPYRPYAD